MGKGSGGAWWAAFLLLAGVLMLAGAEDDGNGAMDVNVLRSARGQCEARCISRYGTDLVRMAKCARRCANGVGQAANEEEAYESGGRGAMDINILRSARTQCEAQCIHRYVSDLFRMAECARRCPNGGGQAANEEEEYETGGRGGEGEGGKCQERCERRHRGDWWGKQRCLMDCKSRREEEGGGSSSCSGGRRCQCKKQCEQRHHDRGSQQQCVEACERRQHEGGGGRDDADGMDGDRCEKQCQHYRDYDMRQQCVRSCRRGRGSWETVAAGTILEVV